MPLVRHIGHGVIARDPAPYALHAHPEQKHGGFGIFLRHFLYARLFGNRFRLVHMRVLPHASILYHERPACAMMRVIVGVAQIQTKF